MRAFDALLECAFPRRLPEASFAARPARKTV